MTASEPFPCTFGGAPATPRHVVALSGGKDSTALALALAEREPRDYEYVILADSIARRPYRRNKLIRLTARGRAVADAIVRAVQGVL